MPRITQRVQNLKKDFMQYHKDGFTIPEIAKKCSVDDSTVYRYLGEIADANGVSRESLLVCPKASNNVITKDTIRRDKIRAEKLKQDFHELGEHLDKIILSLNGLISDLKDESKEYQ